ncbi:MAG: Cysteine desulfurase [Flavobacteriia bacterium]|nr:MAG: Cysteine desulfurase [Flavobacteriia bacterium]
MTADEVQELRKEFPILGEHVHGQPLIYLDNAASSQKPLQVIDAEAQYYRHSHSNVHRGVHQMSQRATEAFEQAREKTRVFLNARETAEIIFTKGCTDAINTVAHGFGQTLSKGDEVLISHLEHHSNIVPWQMACERSGATLKVIPMKTDGTLDWSEELLTEATRIVAVNHVSNALGTINPVERIIADAHAKGAQVLIDGAQSGPHMAIDVQALDADYYCISGHKVYGPTGIGVLYGKLDRLKELPPYQGGGDMIKEVRFEGTTYAEPPFKFEAGTPNIAGAVALGAAFDFMASVGTERIARHEESLRKLGEEALMEIDGLRIYGTAKNKASVISFLIGTNHPYDTGVLLDQMGIAIRTGHHCTQPIMDHYDIPGTARASFAAYNTEEEVLKFVDGVKRVAQMLQ